jgi:hypothetical protein
VNDRVRPMHSFGHVTGDVSPATTIGESVGEVNYSKALAGVPRLFINTAGSLISPADTGHSSSSVRLSISAPVVQWGYSCRRWYTLLPQKIHRRPLSIIDHRDVWMQVVRLIGPLDGN